MPVDDINVLINQFIAADASDGETSVFSSELSSLVCERKVSLLQLIQGLGPTLTSDDVTTRGHSMHCLAECLTRMTDTANVSKQDVNVLLQFLVSKLGDEKLSLHILSALTSLISFKNFLPNVNDNLSTLLNSILSNYEPRKHLAKVRHEGFRFLDVLFAKHSDDIALMPSSSDLFASTFVHVATSEKDPRNLLASFKLNTLINTKFTFDDRTKNPTHDQLLSDLFDVCFCYFPISFTPPANDPYKITAADLKLQLRTTIASQSQFAQDTFPSLFEKLTSTNPTVRNDVLQCLYLCVSSYSAATIEQYWVTIWDALKFEVLHNDVLIFQPEADQIIPPNADMIDDSDDNKTLIYTLRTLATMVGKLSTSDSADSVVTTVFAELKPNFSSLNEKTLKQSVLLLCAMGSTSVKFFNEVVSFLFSFDIWGKYIRSDVDSSEGQEEDEIDISLTVARKRELIDNLGFVFTASKILNSPNTLSEYKDHLLIFMGQLLQTSSTLEKTLKCKLTQQLTKLILLDDFLTREDVTLILGWLGENMNSVVRSDSPTWKSDMLLQEIVTSLVRIMSESPDEYLLVNVSAVIEIILPTLLENVSQPDVLDLINKLCVNYQFLEVLSIRFLNRLAYDDYDRQAFGNMIDGLCKSFIQTQSVKPFLTNSWYQKFVPRFLSVILEKADDDIMILELSGQLLGLVIRFIDQSKHQAILNELVPFFVDCQSYEGATMESVLDIPTARVTLFKHLLAKIDKRTEFPGLVEDTIGKFVSIISKTEVNFIRIGYLQTLAVMVNKFGQDDLQTDALLSQLLGKDGADLTSYEIAIWVLKGLIVRNDPIGSKYLDLVIDQLITSEDNSHCAILSRSFGILMSDLEIFSNTENTKVKIISKVLNLNVRPLYKQRIFESLLPKLIDSFLSTEKELKRELYLATLAIIIHNVSPKILTPHLSAILPLVLNGLSSQNASILEASLQTFDVIIKESPELILENLASLITKLVDLSTKKMISGRKVVNGEQIKLLSLKCLKGIFVELPITKVMKYQHSTRGALMKGLEDKKRSVRKETTDVRQLLFELGR